MVFLSVLPAERAGERAVVALSPYADYYHIDSHVLTTQPGSARRISIRRRADGRQLELRGTIPLNGTGYGEALAVDDPAEWSAILLRDALRRRGVAIYGRAEARHQESEPKNGGAPDLPAFGRLGTDSATAPAVNKPQPVVLAQHLSTPLGEDIRIINKVSQNLHAEMLLRLLGRRREAAARSPRDFRCCAIS